LSLAAANLTFFKQKSDLTLRFLQIFILGFLDLLFRFPMYLFSIKEKQMTANPHMLVKAFQSKVKPWSFHDKLALQQ